MRANPAASTIRRAASLCKWTDTPPKVTHWFAVAESRTEFAIAGIWRLWRDERQARAASIKSMLFITQFISRSTFQAAYLSVSFWK